MASIWKNIEGDWPVLQPNALQLVWVPQISEPKFREKNFSLLDEGEKKRALDFYFEADQNKFINSRACLRVILAQLLGMKNYYVSIVYNDFFKPMLSEEFNLHFNLSHSRDCALFAFSLQGEVGVDVEWVSADRETLALSRKYFEAEAHAKLESLSSEERLQNFYKLWTGKEALLKAQGKGLWEGLSKTQFPLDEFLEGNRAKISKFNLFSLSSFDPAFQASVCWEGASDRIDLYQISLDSIIERI